MLIYADGFDHYGTTPNGGRDAMLAGAWAEMQGTFSFGVPSVSNERARTGTYSLKFPGASNPGNWSTTTRRVIGAARLVVGIGFGIYFTELPDEARSFVLELRNSSNSPILSVVFMPDGSLRVYAGGSGSGSTIIDESAPAINTGAFYHFEMKTVFDPIVGSCEIRVNGITVVNAINVDLGSVGATQFTFGKPQYFGGSFYDLYIDDLVVWDDTGDYNNDFIGQQRVLTVFPDGDASPQEWSVIGEATATEAVSDVPADGDTSYIGASEIGEKATFDLPELPPEIVTIAAVYVPTYARIDDAGVGNIQVNMLSNGQEASGEEIPLTTLYQYRGTVFESDPDTNEAWTKSGIEAANIQIEKTL